MEKGEMYTGFWLRNLRTRDYLEDLGIDSRIILKCILKNRMWAWAGLIWLRIGQMACCFERGDKPLNSLKCGKFLTM